MKTEYKPYVDALIELAIREDIGDGDHTSLCCIPADERGRMRLLCKQEGIIAGIEIARLVLERLDPTVEFDQRIADGTRVRPGDVAFYVAGSLRSLLQAERILLNIMQRMSGVATQTAVYVARLEGLHTKVLDTRKTTPGMRVLDKMAVKLGGGENHRMGLFDMILLKDNHIDFAGGIVPAIRGAKQYLRERDKNIPIEWSSKKLELVDYKEWENQFLIRTTADKAAVENVFGPVTYVQADGVTGELAFVTEKISEGDCEKKEAELGNILQKIRMA